MPSQTATEMVPGYTTIKLKTGQGFESRRVSTATPRDCSLDEIPIIDLSGIYDSRGPGKELALEVKRASEGSGFFYIKNHGIDESVLQKAHAAARK
jgi:hypothetical protein